MVFRFSTSLLDNLIQLVQLLQIVYYCNYQYGILLHFKMHILNHNIKLQLHKLNSLKTKTKSQNLHSQISNQNNNYHLIFIKFCLINKNSNKYAVCIMHNLIKQEIDNLEQELQNISHIIKQIRKIKLIKISLNCSLSLCSIFTLLVQNRLNSMLITTFIFIAIASYKYQTQKIEDIFQKNIEQMNQIEQCIIKLEYFYLLSLSKNKQYNYKCILDIKNHIVSCNNVDCICHIKAEINIFRQFKITYQLNQKQKKCIQIFLLLLSQETKKLFPRDLESEIYYISALTLLNYYPKILNEIVNYEHQFSEHLIQSNILHFLRLNAIQQMEFHTKQEKKTNIQKIKYYEINLKQLNETIQFYCSNKSKTWNMLSNGNVQIQYFQFLLQTDCILRQKIIKMYYQMIQEYDCNQLWKMMFNFARLIARDIQLQKTIKKHLKRSFVRLHSIQINGRMVSLMQNDKVSLIKVSSELKTLGIIKWHNKNTLNLFGYKSNKKLIGENIDIFMPNVYKSSHQQYMKKWYENPKLNKINNFTQIYLSTMTNDFSKAKLYLKLLYSIQNFEMIGMIYQQNKDDNYLILDQNLDIVNKALFLHQLLMQKGLLVIKTLNLACTSNDYLKYLIDNPKRQKTEFKINLRVQKSYDQFIERYKEEVEKIKNSKFKLSEKQIYQRILKLNLTYIQINPMEERIDIQLQVNYSQTQIYGIKYTILKLSSKNILAEYRSETSSDQNKENFNHPYFSDSVSVSTIEQFSILKNKQNLIFGKLESKRLNNFKRVYYLYLCLFLVCLMVRLILSNLHIEIFVELNNADSTISDTMQLTEFLYDNTLVYYSEYKNPKLSQKQLQFYLNQSEYLQNFILNLAEDNNLNSINRNKFSNVNIFQYLSDYLNSSYLQTKNIKMNNNIFIKQWVVNAKQVKRLVFNQSDKTMALDSFHQMNLNFIPLTQMNHYLIDKYQFLGSQNINTLYITNYILISIQIIVILMMILQLNSYLYYKQAEKFEFLEIFTVISNITINKYAIYYELCNKYYDKINQSMFQRISPQNSSINIRCNYKKTYFSYGYIVTIFIFFTFLLWQTFNTYKTNEFVYPAYNGMTYMNQIMDSENYLIEAIIKLRQMLLDVTLDSQQNIQLLNDTIYQNQINFVGVSMNIESIIDNYLAHGKQKLLPILVKNICQVVKNVLTDWQYDNCISINSPILSSGIQSTFNFFQRQIYIALEKFSKNKTSKYKQQLFSDHQLTVADKTMFYQFRIYQAIQAVILEMISSFANDLINVVQAMIIINCFVIGIAFFAGLKFFKNQKQKYQQLCKYIWCIPDEQIKSNKSIQIRINKLKQQSISEVIKL